MPVYEEYQPRPRWRAAHVSDVVPWRAVLAPGVVLQKYRHGLQRTYAMRGPDVQGETPEVQGALMLQANEGSSASGAGGCSRAKPSGDAWPRSRRCPGGIRWRPSWSARSASASWSGLGVAKPGIF
jgi:hypothetical protein